jgi:hypothetical protein
VRFWPGCCCGPVAGNLCLLCPPPVNTTVYATLRLHGCTEDADLLALDGVSCGILFTGGTGSWSGNGNIPGSSCLAGATLGCVGSTTTLLWGGDISCPGDSICANKKKTFTITEVDNPPGTQGANNGVVNCSDLAQLVRWTNLSINRRIWTGGGTCGGLTPVDDRICSGMAEVVLSY